MNFSVLLNPEKPMALTAAQELFPLAEKYGLTFHLKEKYFSLLSPGKKEKMHIICHASDAEAISEGDITIAIGGDGTILKAAGFTRTLSKPILAINSGKLGFLANIQQQNMQNALEHVMSGTYQLDKRFFIEAQFTTGQIYYALNEFVFSRKETLSMITLTAEYDGALINRYLADGLIVSTPTGSTAYNLSAGGSIVAPQTDVLMLTPICPHTLTTRPLILPSGKEIKIKIEPDDQEVLFTADGKTLDIPCDAPVVDIRKSAYCIELIKLPGQSYFETLRNKLMWGADLRKID